jgi:hypothetical protein
MRRPDTAAIYAGILLGHVVMAGMIGGAAMAQATSDSNEPAARGVLVAAATAKGTEPAQIKLDLSKVTVPRLAQLELTVEPTAVSNERYIVVVSTAGDTKKQLGSFSFFPPPRQGEAQKFLVDAQGVVDAMKATNASQADLSVQLVPVNSSSTLGTSALRILGARLVGG